MARLVTELDVLDFIVYSVKEAPTFRGNDDARAYAIAVASRAFKTVHEYLSTAGEESLRGGDSCVVATTRESQR